MTARIKVACTISQLICSNATIRTSNSQQLYQMRQRETPVTLYNGLKLAVGRQQEAIQKQHSLGLSVSADRVMEVRRDFAKAITKLWQENGVVIPPTVKLRIFFTCSTDNCDIAGRFEYHGTVYTITAHLLHDMRGVDPPVLSLIDVPKDAEIKIPVDYANVPYVEDFAEEIKLTPIQGGKTRANLDKDSRREIPEKEWIRHAKQVISEEKGKLNKIPVTWS